LLAYKGLSPWPATASVESFWLTSTLALALVSLLFLVRLEWAMRRAPSQP
jgi:hypothetical protein